MAGRPYAFFERYQIRTKEMTMRKSVWKFLIMGMVIMTTILTGCGKEDGNDEPMLSGFHSEIFGENVYIFTPDDDPEAVKETIDNIYKKQETNQFGKERYALMFMPGVYDESIEVNAGYYTQVLGLGKMPTDTTIKKLKVLARWLSDDPSNNNATCNFWRSVENITMDSNTVWAVSQATDMRRVQVNGALYLHDDYGWASGGFLADSRVTSMIDSGSQQQWLSRNNGYRTWMGENWNMVFSGDEKGGVPTSTWPAKSYTAVEETALIREKPFLVYDGDFKVFVPSWKEHSIGPDWEAGDQPGELRSLDEFYIADPKTDTADTINIALSEKKNLLLTPGIYRLDKPLNIDNPGTIVLGLGLATLTPDNGTECMVTNADDLIIAGILFDAGGIESENLLHMKGSNAKEAVPSLIADVYFRVGGTVTNDPAKTKTCITIDQDNVIGDNLWVWRADHGDKVGWDLNTCPNGIVINGDNISMYALMVEHFNEYQTVWNGNNGQIVMYQSEVPYDVPSPEVWKSHGGETDGFASIKVNDDVEGFTATGIGIYLYNRDNVIPMHCAMEIPDREGVKVHHLITVMLTGHPGMEHGINDAGSAVVTGGQTAKILDYENGTWK